MDRTIHKLKDVVLANLIDNKHKTNYLKDIKIKKINKNKYEITDLEDPFAEAYKYNKSDAISRLKDMTEFDDEYRALVEDLVRDFMRDPNNRDYVEKIAKKEVSKIKKKMKEEM